MKCLLALLCAWALLAPASAQHFGLLGAGKVPAAAGGQGGAITWQALTSPANTAGGATSLGVVATTPIESGEKLLLLQVLGTSANDNPGDPSGWTEVCTALAGEGSWASNSGQRRVKVWEKLADGTEDGTTVTINWTNAAASTAGGSIIRLSGANAGWQATSCTSGSDTTGGTSWSATGSSTEYLVNDLLIVLNGANNGDASATSSTITATGVTFGSTTQRISTLMTGGFGGNFAIASAAVTAAATGAPTIATTYSGGTPSGASLFIRIRNAQ